MKKNLYLLLFFCMVFFFETSLGQGGVWTWMSGTNVQGSPGVFGFHNVPSSNNHPPGLYEACEWKDKQGNFWLYGGGGLPYADLWKYYPATNQWEWVEGNANTYQPPIYGTQGIPSPLNTPGRRDLGTLTWVDTTGNLWLFGGASRYSDLWKYDILTANWTWVSGSNLPYQPGFYGTQGVPGIGNIPGGRGEASSAWTDSLNNLWFFGGYGFDQNGASGCLNDLWKYNIATNEWTWMKGSSVINASSNYGIKRVGAPGNNPGARFSYPKWHDNQGNFWIMGGSNYPGTILYNDLWKYEIGSNQWTWMSGSNLINDLGVYTAGCVFDSINFPSSRLENRATATDKCGKFWLFGGEGPNGSLNDLWIFDPLQLNWNKISGTNIPNQPGNYGTKGIPSATNTPPSRLGSVAWWGDDNRFYLFGGCQTSGFNPFSDVWVFTPDSGCIQNCIPVSPTAIIISVIDSICPGRCAGFSNYSLNATSYSWFFPGASPDTSTDVNPTNICYSTPGNYDVQLIATNANGSDTLFLSNYINVYPSPPPQAITQSGDTLFANTGAAIYQWYFNTTLINGATDYFYIAPLSGDYNVVATDANGCEVEAAVLNVVAEVGSGSWQSSAAGSAQLVIFPNPVEDKFTIKIPIAIGTQVTSRTAVKISINNVLGEMLLAVSPFASGVGSGGEADVSKLSPGLYYVELTDGEKIFRSKFVKQ